MNLALLRNGQLDKELSDLNSNLKTSLNHSYTDNGKEEVKTDILE